MIPLRLIAAFAVIPVAAQSQTQTETFPCQPSPEIAHALDALQDAFHYTFPAIVSKDLLNGNFPMGGLPQAWIVDPQGRRSSPLLLRDTGKVLAELEKAAHPERK